MVNPASTMDPMLPAGGMVSTQNPLIPAVDDSEAEADLGLRGSCSHCVYVRTCVMVCVLVCVCARVCVTCVCVRHECE